MRLAEEGRNTGFMDDVRKMRWGAWWAISACAVLMALISVFNQVKAMGLSWQEEHYRAQLEAVVAGTGTNPAQYRVLSDGLTVWAYRGLEGVGVPRAVGVTFVLIRVFQNAVLFLLAVLYWRRLGLSLFLGVLGIAVLGWGMTLGNMGSDLAIGAHTEVICYLLAGWAIVSGRLWWVVAITFVGALNRETSVLIPVMLLGVHVCCQSQSNVRRDALRVACVSLGVYAAVYLGLRWYFGGRAWDGPTPGFALLMENVGSVRTWAYFAGTMGLIPLLSLALYRVWVVSLRRIFWVMVPAWFVAYFLCGVVWETRMFLLPQVMVFIPGVLFGVAHWRERAAEEAA